MFLSNKACFILLFCCLSLNIICDFFPQINADTYEQQRDQ